MINGPAPARLRRRAGSGRHHLHLLRRGGARSTTTRSTRRTCGARVRAPSSTWATSPTSSEPRARAARPSSPAIPSCSSKDRVIGSVNFDQDPPVFSAISERILECGGTLGYEPKVTETYLFDMAKMPDRAATIIAKLKAEGVTTVDLPRRPDHADLPHPAGDRRRTTTRSGSSPAPRSTDTTALGPARTTRRSGPTPSASRTCRPRTPRELRRLVPAARVVLRRAADARSTPTASSSRR